ncbi:cytidylyltransferase domain-containing protein [Pedobacter hartonius]|uniref:Spore coat polysaccharide biosynthesis protein SpsF, cytidylyltransferase family n=1 Tax=Pedobacter hartonius TaxID=425514 RepID=A0A1H4FRB3_9SPHI|nr:hypothetical protein [Pedobacter hartonius]SEA99889.1 Spore coat polysaccharide biosynthesis protein SpsF, cytidylyltransferase family [Pedobacter hartonius]
MVGIFFTARLGSTRLSQKHLIEVNGKTFIEWLVERYIAEFQREIENEEIKIFITTSVKKENKKFEDIFKSDSVKVFYGSDENIPLRHLQCAEKNNIKYIISIDGDDILCSTQAARILLNKLKLGSDMVYTTGLPLGMNVSGYTVDFLTESLENERHEKLETGWGRIFDKDKIDIIDISGYKQGTHLRMTLDYEEDAEFFAKVINHLKNDILYISDKILIDLILEKNWARLNESLNDTYWANFNKQKQEED